MHEILNAQRKAQLELSPSSEQFTVVGGDNFSGIFDDSHIETGEDGGHITRKIRSARIMVSEVPPGLVERQSQIVRETAGRTYTVKFIGHDAEGVPVIWLY